MRTQKNNKKIERNEDHYTLNFRALDYLNLDLILFGNSEITLR